MEKREFQKIWEIAWPVMLSLVAQNVVNVTDTAFLGRVGEVELGASAIGGLFYVGLFMFAFGFTTGVQILIARRNGEGNFPVIGRIFDNGFFFLLMTTALMTLVIHFWGDRLLRPFISSDSIYSASTHFLRFRILGLFFASSGLLFRSFFTGIAYTKYLSISSGLMAGINVILDYGLIFGHWGLPQLGISGAAIASATSEVCAFVFLVLITIRNKKFAQYELFRWLKPDWKMIRSTLGVSIFVMMQYVLSLGAWFIFFLLIEKMGERPLAVSNIIRSLYMLLMIPAWALCSVVNTLVSTAIGEGKTQEVIPIIFRILRFSVPTMCVILFIAAFLPHQAISIYTNNPSLIQATIPSYYIILIAIFLFSLVSIVLNGVLGTANTKMALLIEGITLVAYLSFTWLIGVHLKLSIEYVWTAEFVYSSLIGLLSMLYLKYGNWRLTKI